MLASLSRWVREGPAATLVPFRFRSPLERMTVARAYPRARSPLRWTLAGGAEATLLFGGDLALHRWDRSQQPDRIFPGLAALASSAEALFLNLETQLTSVETPGGVIGSMLRAPPCAIDVLAYLGVRGVTCANNHCLDFGSQALLESAGRIESAGIAVVGVMRPGHGAGAVVEVRGIRVGLLAYTDDWFVSGDRVGSALPAAHDPSVVRADIAAMRTRADLVVVQLHWGYEWSVYPMLSHRDLARSYVEAGADLVVCHHAHVPMGVETWRGGAIAHGLGNLYFGRPKSRHHPFTAASFVLRVGISRSRITDLEVIPVVTDPEGRVGPSSGAAAREMEDVLGYLSSRLGRAEYLARVEESLLMQQGSVMLHDLHVRVATGDTRGARERVLFLEPPRQRLLTAGLRRAGGPFGVAGELLEDLRDGRKILASPAVAAELAAASRPVDRHQARRPQIGRIP